MEGYHQEEFNENCTSEVAIDDTTHTKEQLQISEVVEKKRKKDEEDHLVNQFFMKI